jgi:hypothetical protein
MYDITEILLKVALNTTHNNNTICIAVLNFFISASINLMVGYFYLILIQHDSLFSIAKTEEENKFNPAVNICCIKLRSQHMYKIVCFLNDIYQIN